MSGLGFAIFLGSTPNVNSWLSCKNWCCRWTPFGSYIIPNLRRLYSLLFSDTQQVFCYTLPPGHLIEDGKAKCVFSWCSTVPVISQWFGCKTQLHCPRQIPEAGRASIAFWRIRLMPLWLYFCLVWPLIQHFLKRHLWHIRCISFLKTLFSKGKTNPCEPFDLAQYTGVKVWWTLWLVFCPFWSFGIRHK